MQNRMHSAYLLVRIDKRSGSVVDAIVTSEWPVTWWAKDTRAWTKLMSASGSSFASARARVIRHASRQQPWVLRFLRRGEIPVAAPGRRPSARRARRGRRVVVGTPRVVVGRRR